MSDRDERKRVVICKPVPRERDERDIRVAEVMRQVRCGVAEFTLCPTRPTDPKLCEGCPEKGRRVDEDTEEFA